MNLGKTGDRLYKFVKIHGGSAISGFKTFVICLCFVASLVSAFNANVDTHRAIFNGPSDFACGRCTGMAIYGESVR